MKNGTINLFITFSSWNFIWTEWRVGRLSVLTNQQADTVQSTPPDLHMTLSYTEINNVNF